jgi:BirA family biotin operon repressor/biotin-[acetyl-CoA-carboxylase] ligase
VGSATFKRRNTERAKSLRRTVPPAERVLWRRLSGRQLAGFKVSRQMPIGPYFADFLCRERRLAIELDGYSHDMRVEEDVKRDAYMIEAGYRVLRFSNEDVAERLEGVLLTIAEALAGLADAHQCDGRPCPRHGLRTAGGSSHHRAPLPQAGGVK